MIGSHKKYLALDLVLHPKECIEFYIVKFTNISI